jgi:predicted aspartyl protease
MALNARKRAPKMGTFSIRGKVENPVERTRAVVIPKILVDTGSEFTWVSERMLEKIGIQPEKKDVSFVLANGQQVTRSVGFAIIRIDKYFTIDEVVFAEPGDLQLLGARTLEGLNLTVEPGRKRLVAAGPVPAASPSTLLPSPSPPTRKRGGHREQKR